MMCGYKLIKLTMVPLLKTIRKISQLEFGIHSNYITSFLGFKFQFRSIQIGTIRDKFLLTGVQVQNRT